MVVRKKISKIGFGLFSSKMIQKLSSTKIHTPNTYDEDGYPVEGGLMDPRLGVIDPGIRCKTCGGGLGDCQGHFGHIELTRPVIHVGYAKEVYMLLRITCRACSRILLPENKLEKHDPKNMSEEDYTRVWAKAMKTTDSENKCPYCGEKQTKIKFVRPYSYYESENIFWLQARLSGSTRPRVTASSRRMTARRTCSFTSAPWNAPVCVRSRKTRRFPSSS